MAMTPESFTGDHTFDMLVGAYLIVRIIVSASMSLMCAPQVYYEYLYLFAKKRFKFKRLNPRILVLIGLTMYPIFRILYSAILFKTHDFDYGSVVVYLGMWTTNRMWIFSWSLWGLVLAYTVGYSIISALDKKATPMFYTAGFLVLLVFFGIFAVVNYFILYRQIKKYETKMRSDNMSLRVRKLKILSAALVVTIVCVLIRDLVYYVIIKVPMDHNLRHLSSFITFFFEALQGVIIMIAVSERPSYYFLFRNVNPHRGDSTASSHVSSESNSQSVASKNMATTITIDDGASSVTVQHPNINNNDKSHVVHQQQQEKSSHIALTASNLVEWSDDEDEDEDDEDKQDGNGAELSTIVIVDNNNINNNNNNTSTNSVESTNNIHDDQVELTATTTEAIIITTNTDNDHPTDV
ncbi:hypothetical protein DFA_02691 [Cavenderia fasciculata]|uniref:Uncharacterized protein n=1 Tax=Cavenderia fasciculata TaxID=261658 RepID=F4Q037_CACFS|nr:uncharacterized protein DFA_02691 [Cavenderia fasciculata]EGG18951.1 hypothetical protein DFA_02691 [Cavenderia fasciculata]|eukprot:XP_004357413.1 hypothetical protein DFA_02691 [Cavenderia fasciculata]